MTDVRVTLRRTAAVHLLDTIVSDTTTRGTSHPQPMLAAIADGTFGSMKRPPTKGKGLDGVVVKADGYDNPATTLLEEGATR